MSFNLELYWQVWQKLNQSQIIAQAIDIATPIPLAVFASIPSTNNKLWELIDRKVEYPLGAIALQQTAGKGQWGNSWVSANGGLYLSIGFDLDLKLHKYPHLVMATVWGVATVLRHHQLPVTIKWSNDLILDRCKLGGIKIETRNSRNKISQAVIGVGINWRNAVPNLGINLESYCQNNNIKNINSLEELAAITAYGIVLGYQDYLSVGIEKLLDKYLTIFHNLGQQVNINGCPGQVIGVTSQGELKVKLRSPGATTEIALSPGQISLGY